MSDSIGILRIAQENKPVLKKPTILMIFLLLLLLHFLLFVKVLDDFVYIGGMLRLRWFVDFLLLDMPMFSVIRAYLLQNEM